MNKICLMINDIDELKISADTFIIGLKDYNSLNVLELDINSIKDIKNKDIIISINKVIHNSEIDKLTSILKDLNGYKILFDDYSILQIVKENKLDIELIWCNLRATTNYNSINSLYDMNVSSAVLSPDITIDEMIEIKNNTKASIFIPLYGKFNIFTSNRFLITNYLKYIGKEKKDVDYKINDRGINYNIYEDKNGTHIVNGKCTNGISYYKKILDNNCDYVIINSYDLDINIYDLVNSFITLRTLYYEKLLDLKTLIHFHNKFTNINTDSGFLDKKTIYKVGDKSE